LNNALLDYLSIYCSHRHANIYDVEALDVYIYYLVYLSSS